MGGDDDEVPAYRRAMPPPPLGYHGPHRRSINDMTGPEAGVFVVALIAAALTLAVILGPLWLGMDPSDAFAWSPLAAPVVGAGGAWWTRHHAPWHGPSAFQRWRKARRRGPVRRALSWFAAWWGRPGRLGIAVALLGAAFAAAGFSNAAEDRSLVSDLRNHGQHSEGTVTDVDFAPRSGRGDVTVRFNTDAGPRTENLGILDTVPNGIRRGDRVEVVFDPGHPDRILLPSQLTDGHAEFNTAMARVSIAVAIAGLLWWAARTPARTRQRKSEPQVDRRS